MTALGRVLDRGALDEEPGGRARVRISVPVAWAAERATVVVQPPERVPCARCDGGGCDACGRSGVLRLDPDPDARTFTLSLPVELGEGVVLRVARPFGDASPVVQVLCEVRAGAEPVGCRRVPGDRPPARSSVVPRGVALALLVTSFVAWLLLHR